MNFAEIKTIDVYKISGFNEDQKKEFNNLESITNLSPIDLIELHSLYSNFDMKSISNSIFNSIFKINYFIGANLVAVENYFEKNNEKKDYVNNIVSHLLFEKGTSVFDIDADLKQLEEKLYSDVAKEYSYLDEVVEPDFEDDLYSELDKQIDLKYLLENKLNEYFEEDKKIMEKNNSSLFHYAINSSAERKNAEFLYDLYSNNLFDKVLYYTDSTTVLAFDVLELF